MPSPASTGDDSVADKRELVLGILALLGGDTRSVGLDQIALVCHRLAPAVFAWPEYSWLPQLDNVRVNLHHATKKGLVSRQDKFYRLTASGIQWCKDASRFLDELRGRIPDPKTTASCLPSELLAVALRNVGRGRERVARERLVAEAFRLFPEVFGLDGFPGWPDAARVDRAIAESPWIERAQGALELRPEHLADVERLVALLQTRSAQFRSERRTSSGGSASKAIVRIERSPTYQSFRAAGAAAAITDGEFCDLLSVTLEAPQDLIRARIDTLRALVEQAERRDLLDYIDWLRAGLDERGWLLVGAKLEGAHGE